VGKDGVRTRALKAVGVSSTTAFSSSRPSCAAALSIAYSPPT
jgi:hypothetical protein